MKRTPTEPIGNVLSRFFENHPQLADKIAETRLINHWQNAMGQSIARYTEQIYIHRRTLYVQLKSAVLKNELMMHRQKLIITLNEKAGRHVIDKIIFI